MVYVFTGFRMNIISNFGNKTLSSIGRVAPGPASHGQPVFMDQPARV